MPLIKMNKYYNHIMKESEIRVIQLYSIIINIIYIYKSINININYTVIGFIDGKPEVQSCIATYQCHPHRGSIGMLPQTIDTKRPFNNAFNSIFSLRMICFHYLKSWTWWLYRSYCLREKESYCTRESWWLSFNGGMKFIPGIHRLIGTHHYFLTKNNGTSITAI